jgi:hypothetical protein
LNVLRIANRRCDRLINFSDFSRGGEEGDELGDFCFRPSKALDKARVVENSLNFFENGTRENKPVSTIEKLKEECFGWSGCPRMCPDKDERG